MLPGALDILSKCLHTAFDALTGSTSALMPQAAMDEIFLLGVQLAEGVSPRGANERILELNQLLRQWSSGQDKMQGADKAGSDGRAHLPRTPCTHTTLHPVE